MKAGELIMALDWKSIRQPVPQVRGTVCDSRDDLGLALIQQGKNKFAVLYGLQLKKDLTYSRAAAEYGACLMHALTCESKIKGEE